MKPSNIVFDIDGTLSIVIGSYEEETARMRVIARCGEAFFERHCIVILEKYPHYIFPGYYALFQWLHSKGAKIFFFSSGEEIRNVPYAAEIMARAFGANPPAYQVFSRQHCVDTSSWGMSEEEKATYQSYFYGQRKKKLAGIVVPAEELPQTLLIEDDNSYMVKGEEFNFVCTRYAYQYLPNPDRSEWEDFEKFHKSFYLAGIFSDMFDLCEQQGATLAEAAKIVQIDRENAELSDRFYYPGTRRIEYYEKGLEILKGIDPTLRFYIDLPEKEQ